ncbi:MAG: aroE [Acidobacteria bacterium]|nr:aroE [Acidobacteriota bacterium]
MAETGLEDLRRARDAAARVADLVELRLDRLARPDAAGALAGRAGPVVVTCRPSWEGGWFEGAEEDRFALLDRALELGAEFVDVEWRAADRARALLARWGGTRVVLSLHDFTGVPGDLEERCRTMLGTGARVVKIAVTAARLADSLPLLALAPRFAGAGLALVAMGTPGAPSRILAARFGSCWTYAGEGTAPGQIPAGRLIEEFRFRSITPATRVYGILGRPVSHSVSPAMHNAGFAERGIDAVYVPFEAASVEDFRQLALALDVRGASVTAPFKIDVVPYLGRCDRWTRRVGACNTLRVSGDRWDGRNTDVEGFLAPLRGRVRLEGLRVAIVGAGGAARAAAAGLADAGASVTVHARRAGEAAAVAEVAGGRAAAGPPQAGEWDLLVNATPLGSLAEPGRLPVDPAGLGAGLVYDLVYNPPGTPLRRAAEAAGCDTIGGLDMLVAQAARLFVWWTGPAAPGAVLRAAAARALGRV